MHASAEQRLMTTNQGTKHANLISAPLTTLGALCMRGQRMHTDAIFISANVAHDTPPDSYG